MTDSPPRILVGRFGAAHGVRGEIRVKSYTADPMALADYDGLTDSSGARSFRIESARLVKDDIIVARLRGVNDRNAAEALTNSEIYLARDALPPPDEDEFYIADLVGMRAELGDGTPFGTIANVLNFGAGDILEIAPAAGGETILLPFTRAAVPELDFPGGRIIVVPPREIEEEEEEEEGAP